MGPSLNPLLISKIKEMLSPYGNHPSSYGAQNVFFAPHPIFLHCLPLLPLLSRCDARAPVTDGSSSVAWRVRKVREIRPVCASASGKCKIRRLLVLYMRSCMQAVQQPTKAVERSATLCVQMKLLSAPGTQDEAPAPVDELWGRLSHAKVSKGRHVSLVGTKLIERSEHFITNSKLLTCQLFLPVLVIRTWYLSVKNIKNIFSKISKIWSCNGYYFKN